MRTLIISLLKPNESQPPCCVLPIDEFPDWVFTKIDKQCDEVLDNESDIGHQESVAG